MHHAENLSTQSSSTVGYSIPMFYRMREVLRMTGLSRSTLYRRIADGTFPAPVSLGGSAKGWRRSDLEEWGSEEHTSELQSLMRISYAVFCLKNKKNIHT